jgi:aryl sulfotransferase
MKILQIGVAKSGNFWLYKILQNIAKYGGLEQKTFIQNQPIHSLAKTWDLSYEEQADIDVLDIKTKGCFYRISSIFCMPIENIDEYLRQTSHVWTHSTFCQRSFEVLPKFDKVVYLIRDPRDSAVSAYKFRFTPYAQKYLAGGELEPDIWFSNAFEPRMKLWVRHVGGYLKHMHELSMHVIFYERLLHSFRTEFDRLLDYLEIDLDESSIERIQHEVDFTTMKKKNPQHVRKGRSNQWEDLFSDGQKRQAQRIAGPMCELLHYPCGKVSKASEALPSVPQHLSEEKIDSAIRHATRRTIFEKMKRLYTYWMHG